MKKILIGIVVLLVVAAGAIVFVISNLDGIIREAVETAGTKVTQVKVTLDKVDIDLTSGKGALGGLTVGNPAGFETDYAFSLGGVSVEIDTATVTGNPIVIKEVIILAPKVIYELGSSGSNIDAIQKNVENFTKQIAGSGGSSSNDAASSNDGDAVKVIIENLYIRGGEVAISASFLGGKKMGADIPEIHLKDIGKDDDGASPAEIAAQIIAALNEKIMGSVGGLNLDGLAEGAQEMATEAAAQATKAVEDAAKSVTGDGDVGNVLKDGAEGAGNALKGLLGN